MKKAITLLLCAAMLFGITGCAASNDTGSGSANATEAGRYVEQLIDVPQPEGYSNQYIIGLSALENGLEVFTCSYSDSDNGSQAHYFRHTILNDGSVKTTDEQWLNDLAVEGGNELRVKRAEDGTLYLFVSNYNENGEVQPHFYVSHDDGKTGSELTGNGIAAISVANSFGVLADGSIAYSDYYNANLGLLTANGDYADQLEGEANKIMPIVAAQGTKIATIAPEAKAVRVYDRADGTSADYEYAFSEENASLLEYAQDGSLYLCDSTGLYRHTQEGTIWERIMDGNTSNLGLPSFYAYGIAVSSGDPDTIYVYGGENVVLKYVFDPSAPLAASRQINIFSLHENETIQQAVVVFNRSQSEVTAVYNVAMDQGAGGTEQDYIKSLNTELLAGTGPDVLVLDGLPIDSYIQKGVLADLGSVVDGAEAVLPNIRAASQASDGVLYAMPSGVLLPLAFAPGNPETTFSSLTALADACEQAGEVPLLANAAFSNQTLAEVLMKYYGNSLNTGNTDTIRSFLTDAGRIAQATGSTDTLCEGWEATEGASQEEMLEAMRINNGGPQFWACMTGRAQGALLLPLGSLVDIMLPYAASEQKSVPLSGVANAYEPVGLVGINKAGANQDAAAEFVQMLLSYTVQHAIKYTSAFPVNMQAITETMASVDNTISQSMHLDATNSLDSEWPSEAVRNQLLSMIQQVNVPLTSDATLSDMLSPVIVAYLNGSDTLETAAEKMQSVISTYLSE